MNQDFLTFFSLLSDELKKESYDYVICLAFAFCAFDILNRSYITHEIGSLTYQLSFDMLSDVIKKIIV